MLEKAPGDVENFGFSWVKMLMWGDVVLTSTWAAQPGITLGVANINTVDRMLFGQQHPPGTITAVMVAGGTVGSHYDITNTVVTAAGRVLNRKLRVHVRDAVTGWNQ
jgi:hypothetical protein